MKIILASNSPRRKEILKKHGFDFEVIPSPYEEVNFTSDPFVLTESFALNKAKAVFDRLTKEEKETCVVIGSDTVVYFDGKILGKPASETQAVQMLSDLSDNTHSVITAYALVTKEKTYKGFDKTEVTFNKLTPTLIDNYVKTGSPMDKAGAYGIQDDVPLVKKINGSLDTVIGFPTEKVIPILAELCKK